jgi:Family of unknown function (DUF6459)
VSVPALDPSSGGAHRPRRPTVRRVPRLEPPYDDELPDGLLGVIRQREELPFDEPAPRRFEHEIDFFDPQPTARRDLPDPEAWATRFLQAVFETLAGSRASAQLQEWTSRSVRAQISRMTFDVRWKTPPGVVPLVKSVRVSEPADGVAEVAAVVLRGAVYSAAAARLEGFDGRWRAVALEVR